MLSRHWMIRILLFSVMLLCVVAVTCTAAFCFEVTPSMKALIAKNESLGLKKFPISFWSYTNLRQHGEHMTEAEVKSWADAGFTVPQSPTFDPKNKAEKAHIIKILQWADKYGMKLILTDPRGYAQIGKDGKAAATYADGIQAAVKDFGKYPALFGFHVGDEPGANIKDAFFECCRLQKEAAPKLHPFANLLPYFPWILDIAGTDTWPHYLDEYAKKTNADLVGYDCYVQMNPGDDGWNVYYQNLKYNREASLRNGIPFWNTILSVGHYNYRVPNQDELKWQFNTSIASGANGIVYFYYYVREPEANYRMSPVDEHWEKTITYYSIQRYQKSFHRRYGDLFNHLASTRVTFVNKAFGEGELFTPDDLIQKIDCGPTDIMVVGEFTDANGKRYAMFVNNSMTNNTQFHITFPKGSRIFSLDWWNHEYEGGAYCCNGYANDAEGNPLHHIFLAPGQEAVYRVELAK